MQYLELSPPPIMQNTGLIGLLGPFKLLDLGATPTSALSLATLLELNAQTAVLAQIKCSAANISISSLKKNGLSQNMVLEKTFISILLTLPSPQKNTRIMSLYQ